MMKQAPLPTGEYEVFLNFRGFDVRNGFASTLEKYLKNYGIRAFFDDRDLHKGEEIDPKLMRSIEESKIYIPIISKNYASSRSPLAELAHMVRCCKKEKGHLMLPIFYMVEVGDVKDQRGPFKTDFKELANKHPEATITEWKKALRIVAEFKGWTVTQSTRQGDTIDEVFSSVRSLLMENYKLVTGIDVGMDRHVEKVKGLLNKGGKIVGIQGMSGIGKTNIAKAVYNSVGARFNRCCFVEDVRDILSEKSVAALQSRILSDILRHDIKVRDSSQGIQKIKDRVCCWNDVLIVLDNVDEGFVFADVLGDLEHFHPKTRFVITTVDKRSFKFFENYELYQPQGMDDDIALQLFSRHAFGTDHPPRGYRGISKDIVKVAAGLPLAVKAVGSLLFRRKRWFWDAKLQQFRNIPPTMVQNKLKIVYKELTRHEQLIFLDIACYFIGESCDRASYLWSDSRLDPLVAIDTLRLKSLIKIDKKNRFWMHDQYKILGRAIVGEEDILDPWRRSRMWSYKDTMDMLRDKKGTVRLEGLRIHMRRGEGFELTEKEFRKLSGLRFLEVHAGKMNGDFKKILPNLRWLKLHQCTSVPVDFKVENLVILDMNKCPVSDGWRSWNRIKMAHRLKAIDVSFCRELTEIPDLSQCRSLERINFESCLNMRGEINIENFKDLSVLDISNTKITKVVGDIERLRKLKRISADNSRLRGIPASIGRLSSLETLELRGIRIEVPKKLPKSLKTLTLSSPRVPNLSELTNLRKLWLSCDGLEIPEGLRKLSKLKDLTLVRVGNRRHHNNSRRLSSPVLPSSLNTLRIEGREPIKRLPNLLNLRKLTSLCLRRVGVRTIAGLVKLRMLKTFQLQKASNLVSLDGIQRLERLDSVRVEGCRALRGLPSLSNLSKLRELRVTGCRLDYDIQGIKDLLNLSTLVLD